MASQERLRELENILLAQRKKYEGFWPGLDDKDQNGRVTLAGANHFFLGCINDMYAKVEQTWAAAERFIFEIAPDPETIWGFIANSHTPESWLEKIDEYKLHRVPKDFMRNYRIAHQIFEKYAGDPRNIWERDASGKGLHPSIIAERLLNKDFRMGDKLTYMVIGALKDNGIVSGKSDIKADVNTTRVLGRVIMGGEIKPEEAVALAREIHPEDPWNIDQPLYFLGINVCKARVLVCDSCFLSHLCEHHVLNQYSRRMK